MPSKPQAGSLQEGTTEYKVSAKVEARLNPYIQANPADVARYTKLVKENPERAVRSLMLKDLDMVTEQMKLVRGQVEGAKQYYAAQPAEKKAYIDEQLAKVGPYHKDLRLVKLVLNEMGYRDRQQLRQAPAARPGVAA